jgi:hypothetical protein
MFLFSGQQETIAECAATIAVAKSVTSAVVGSVATEGDEAAVCRAFIVLPLNGGLGAGGVGGPSGGGNI